MTAPLALRRLEPAAVVLLLALFLWRALAAREHKSAGVDEPMYIAGGVLYWSRGDLLFNAEHPPLAKALAALPLRGLELRPLETLRFWPTYRERGRRERAAIHEVYDPHNWLACELLYENTVPARTILQRARLPGVALGLLLCLLVHLWARARSGTLPALAALLLVSQEPTVLAFSQLVMTDLPVAVFLLAATLLFARALEAPRFAAWPAAGAGLALGAALGTKHTALLWLPLLALLAALAVREPLRHVGRRAALLATVWGVAALVVWLLYGSAGPAGYLESIRRLGSADPHHLVYFHGRTSWTGWWYYYPVALALKMPLGFLALGLAGLAILARRAVAGARDGLLVALPPAAVLVFAMTSARDVGVRYLLPAYPFLALGAAAAVGRALAAGRRARLAAAGLVAWAVSSSLLVHPFDLAYFNLLAGGPRGGYRWLVDSNLDFGQDLPGLGKLLRESGPGTGLYLAALRPAYGASSARPWIGSYQAAPPDGPGGQLLPDDPSLELLAVSATIRQGYGMGDPADWSWLDARRPHRVVGHSIFVYDITRDVGAHRELARLYRAFGRYPAELAREERRIAALEGRQPPPPPPPAPAASPAPADALLEQGLARYRARDLASAIELTRQALALDPGSALGRNNLGYYLMDAGDLAAAVRELELAVSLDPGSQLARNNLAEARRRLAAAAQSPATPR